SELLIWCSPEGRALALKILGSDPYVPHDYQLEGIVQTLDRKNLVVITPTGSGKSGYFCMPMRILLAISRDPSIVAPYQYNIPDRPKAIFIFPTNALEEQMAACLTKYGVRAMAINGNTLHVARQAGHDLWALVRSDDFPAICLSPEQLTSKDFERLLNDKIYVARVCIWGTDEIHLLHSWGHTFRKSFQEIGNVCCRLGTYPPLIGLSATLPKGERMKSVLSFLNLSTKLKNYYLIHRSNLRHDIQFMFRELRHGLQSYSFPQLYWILKSGRKTIIFCRTISLSFRIFVYLWNDLPSTHNHRTFLRMYNSLNPVSYNSETLALFREVSGCGIILSTFCLIVGIDIPDVEDVVRVSDDIADVEDSNEDDVQMAGRAGRDPSQVSHPRFIHYFSKSAVARARKAVADSGNGKKNVDPSMSLGTAQLLLASCIPKALDAYFDNPSSDTPCTCPFHIAHPTPARPSICRCS
ncbi:P-loop containing nucleoside triphosphate hydrolase protein, partial [Fistulina hepatica ATCC 64428]